MNIRSLVVAIAVLVITMGVCVAQGKCPQGAETKLWGGLESKPKTADSYTPDKAEIGIGSYRLLELRGPAAGYTLAEREVAVYNRLTEALSIGPLTPDMICVGRVRSAPTIYVGPVRFVSVYASDAAAAGTTRELLAHAWRDSLAAVLPTLTKPTGSKCILPAGVVPGTYEVAVGGALLFRLRGPDGFVSLAARGQAAEASIVRMLSDGNAQPTAVVASAVAGNWVVKFGNLLIVTATSEDAVANGTTPQLLAEAWVAKVNAQLGKLKGPTGDNPTE
jgi:hypothetical protein